MLSLLAFSSLAITSYPLSLRWRPAPGVLLSDSVNKELVLTVLTETFRNVIASDPVIGQEEAVGRELPEFGRLRWISRGFNSGLPAISG